MILALTSLCRVSELTSIEFNSITVDDLGVKFSLNKFRKNQRGGALKTFSLTRMVPESSTCPVACFSSYLIKSFDFRSNVDGKTPWASTIARWIKEVLTSAGIDVNLFSVHSTRGAAASKAFASGIPVVRILKAGGWASESVFSRHNQQSIGEAESDGLAVVS